jgi:hypothetical protein
MPCPVGGWINAIVGGTSWLRRIGSSLVIISRLAVAAMAATTPTAKSNLFTATLHVDAPKATIAGIMCSFKFSEHERHGRNTRTETVTKSTLERGQSSRCSSVNRIGSVPSLTPNAQSTVGRITAKMEPNSYVAKHELNPHSPGCRRDENRAGVSCALARRSGRSASS